MFAGFGVVLALLVAIGYIGLSNTTELASQFKTLSDDRMASVMKLAAAQEGLYELRLGSASLTYVLTSPQKRAVMLAQDEQVLKQVDDNMRAFGASTSGDESLAEMGNVNAAAALRAGDLTTAAGRSDDSLNRLLATQQRAGKQMSQDAVNISDLWQRVLVFFTLVALGIGLGVAFFVSRGVARGVQAVQKALTSLTENCARSLEEGLAAMSAKAIQSIAAVAEEQSASTEEVSASAEEMSVQIDEVTAQAQQLSSTAEQLRRLVARFRLQEVVADGPSNVVPLRRAA